MGASYPTKLLLAFRNGDRCAFLGCQEALTLDGDASDPVVVGEAAHIAGENSTDAMKSARYDVSMTPEQRDGYANLIYLCRKHHTQVDKQELDFPTDRLQKMKQAHEERVREALLDGFADVGLEELLIVTDWLGKADAAVDPPDYSLTPLEEKMAKNELSSMSALTIRMGLGAQPEVRMFLETVIQDDVDFPERLTHGFLAEYHRLKHEGFVGDDLFDMLCVFAQRGFKKQSEKSAALAVLIYLFEACEVFEK